VAEILTGPHAYRSYTTDGVLKTFSFRLPASLQFDSKYEFSVKAEKENPAEEFILSIDTCSFGKRA
jgi:hypothetical protein